MKLILAQEIEGLGAPGAQRHLSRKVTIRSWVSLLVDKQPIDYTE